MQHRKTFDCHNSLNDIVNNALQPGEKGVFKASLALYQLYPKSKGVLVSMDLVQ